MLKTLKINDLEQVKLLADPLKLKLLQAFAAEAKTTKQVAAELGQSITKLYRHVDALHDAGFLEVTEERQKRGTIERTFRATAERFEADRSLFSDESSTEGMDAARDLLRAGEEEILHAIASASDSDAEEPVIMRLRCKASPKRIKALSQALTEWIEATQETDEEEATEYYGAMVAFYPLDSTD